MRNMSEEAGARVATLEPAPGRETAQRAGAEICTLQQWLTDRALSIPSYQRPYKWALPQVQQLLTDIEEQTRATLQEQGARSYRMGTVVVHVEPQGAAGAVQHHIVDGQQRTVTLLLVLHALRALPPPPDAASGAEVPAWRQRLLRLELFEPRFSHALSQQQVQINYQAIARHVRQLPWGEKQVLFLLDRCEVVRVRLHSLTEAFQFFDAQNGRGKALCAHDLLKAFHLRALRPAELARRGAAVQDWEQCEQADLERLFARFLFQTRQRSRGRDAEFFGKRHVAVFKGLRLEADAAFPMARAWRMLDDVVQGLESQGHGDRQEGHWPCQLDAPVVNGLRFFHWVRHYRQMEFHREQAPGQLPPWTQRLTTPLAGHAQGILRTLGEYPGHGRRGDGHVRAVFDALLMYYLDKFGEQDLGRAVELAFAWAYARLLHGRVVVGSMDKFVSEGPVNPFAVLRDAVAPQDFLHLALPAACYKNGQPPLQGLDGLQQWMKTLGYWKDVTHGGSDDPAA